MFTQFVFSPVVLASILGVILSAFFAYFPGVRDWFAELRGDYKRLIMLVGLAIVACAVYGFNCAGWIIVEGLSCDPSGMVVIVKAFVAALIANQTTYLVSPGQK